MNNVLIEAIKLAIKFFEEQLSSHKAKLAELESGVHTDTSPVPRNGKCPAGYYVSGDGKSCILDV